MKKRMIAIAAATMATMMMATPVLADDYKIGICNYVDDASLNQIVDNLESRLAEIGEEKGVNFEISYDNCNADANVMEQIISDFQADGVDLMVGVATPVAMRMQASTEGTDTPVVFSAVSDPVGAGLVESLDAPGANLTGTSDYLDTASIMKLIEAVNPDTKKIGLLYDIGQDSSTAAIEAAKAYMDENGIEYVKWDMNRSMADVYASNVTYDYVIGVYDFLEKLTSKYPNILIEGCSGGGGRFDAGMLYYTPQIWCSDNTDAINRTRIQYGTSFFYPVAAMGSHVSAVPNHQTGRVTSLHTRGVAAMSGTFGYELNPALLSVEEKAEIRMQLAKYREHQELIREGNYYRLSDPFQDDFAAWMVVSEDQNQALVSVVRLTAEANPVAAYVTPRGLAEDAFYLEKTTGKVYAGAALMEAGMLLPAPKGEYEAYQIMLQRVTE